MFDFVLKNGMVFYEDSFENLDLAITKEKISAIGKNLQGKREIDLSGKWILPGAIDAHTHFSLPFAGAVSADDFFSGTKAGAIGGVTTIIDFLAQKDGEPVSASLKRRQGEARDLAAVDYSFHACIGQFNESVMAEMSKLAEMGLTSLKVFMAYRKAGLMQDDYSLRKIMRACNDCGIMLTVHAENGDLIDRLIEEASNGSELGIEKLPITRPVITEVEAIRRLALFASETGCLTYVVHTSSGSGANEILSARENGAPIIGETCPQYLYLDDSLLVAPEGQYFSCCPPIRNKKEQTDLWNGIKNGHLAVVATDHCPFTRKDKDSWNGNIMQLPMGLPGVETLPALVINGVFNKKLTLVKALKAISENPAKLFGLYPEKGSLLPGTDADIMVFDPEYFWKISARELNMETDYSPYEGLTIRGKNIMTILRGSIVYSQNDGWQGNKGGGKFLKRKKADHSFF
ncbi:MAG: dihydropyrimidinase [Candidatus Rifleibacteriota bacterium]